MKSLASPKYAVKVMRGAGDVLLLVCACQMYDLTRGWHILPPFCCALVDDESTVDRLACQLGNRGEYTIV